MVHIRVNLGNFFLTISIETIFNLNKGKIKNSVAFFNLKLVSIFLGFVMQKFYFKF